MSSGDPRLSEALRHLTAGHAHLAIPYLGEYLASYPDDVLALCWISRALVDVGHSSEALHFAERAVELAPDQSDVWLTLSVAAAAQNLGMRSVTAAQTAARLTPDDPSLLRHYAQTMADTGVWPKKAVSAAQRASALDPTSADNYVTLGNAYLSRKRLRKAERSYQQALRVDPQNTSALHNLSLVDVQNGRFGSAARRSIDALRYAPTNDLPRAVLVSAAALTLWFLTLIEAVYLGLVGIVGYLLDPVAGAKTPTLHNAEIGPRLIMLLILIAMAGGLLWYVGYTAGPRRRSFLIGIVRFDKAAVVWTALVATGLAFELVLTFSSGTVADIALVGVGCSIAASFLFGFIKSNLVLR